MNGVGSRLLQLPWRFTIFRKWNASAGIQQAPAVKLSEDHLLTEVPSWTRDRTDGGHDRHGDCPRHCQSSDGPPAQVVEWESDTSQESAAPSYVVSAFLELMSAPASNEASNRPDLSPQSQRSRESCVHSPNSPRWRLSHWPKTRDRERAPLAVRYIGWCPLGQGQVWRHLVAPVFV